MITAPVRSVGGRRGSRIIPPAIVPGKGEQTKAMETRSFVQWAPLPFQAGRRRTDDQKAACARRETPVQGLIAVQLACN
jgi:hypothetical protein